MDVQGNLFGGTDAYGSPVVPPRSRSTDPETSHEAEAKIRADGTLWESQERALKLLRANPGLTSNELEQATGFLNGCIRKRLSELRRMGLAKQSDKKRTCRVTGYSAFEWWAV